MKKILSLFLSLILTLSVITGSVTAFAVAGGNATLANVHLDLSADSLKVVAETSTTKKIGNKIIIFGPSTNSRGETNVFDTDAYFGERAVIVTQSPSGSAENSDMRFQISMGGMNSGKMTFVFDLYMATDDSCRMNLRLRSGSSYLSTVSFMDLGLNTFEWYTIKVTVDFENTSDNCKIVALKSDGSVFNTKTFTCNFTGKALDNMFIWGTPKSDGMPQGAPDSIKNELAFYAMKDLIIYREQGIEKAQIVSVASSGEAEYNQKNLSFVLSEPIEGLTKDHITVKSTSGDIKASQITTYDTGKVDVVLERDLAPWSDYILEIDGSAYGSLKEVTSDGIGDVSAIKADFHTATAPFDMKEPVFTYDGSALNAETQVINTTGTPKDLCFVLVSYTAQGQVKEIATKSFNSFVAAYPGSDADVSNSATDGDVLRLFVIDNQTNRLPLFGKSWTVNYDGSPATVVTSSGENTVPSTIALGDFDYDNKKISVDLKCATSDATEGVLSVYSKDGNCEYIDYIATTGDGTYSKELKFRNGFEYGEYIVEFKPATGVDAIVNEFVYYTPQQILDNKRSNIFVNAVTAPTAGALMAVITGTNENEEIINDNFEVFLLDAEDTYYSKLKNKADVFALMKQGMSTVDSYDKLVNLFETSAKKRYDTENKPSSAPSSNNKGYGSTSSVVNYSKPADEVAVVPGVATASKLSDISGHWAEKFAATLCDKGVINGYDDGTFRGENNITRAELAKILAETFAGEASGEKSFADVSNTSWYAPYVKKAAASGIVNGFDDGSFRPDTNVTREDAIVMIYRALGLLENLPEGYTLFADDLEISPYAQAATRCLGELGIVTGDSNKKLSPKNNITRYEVAALICRSLDYTQAH